MIDIAIRNEQKSKRLNLPLLRRIVKAAAIEHLQLHNLDLGIHIVEAGAMAKVNAQYLQHEGATDVITFDHSDVLPENAAAPDKAIHGELFVCIDVAIAQAREFGTTWQSELVRYTLHGLLHLLGCDDRAAAARRVMKRREDELVDRVSKDFRVGQIGQTVRRGRTGKAPSRRTAPRAAASR